MHFSAPAASPDGADAPRPPRIGAVLISYNPPADLPARLQGLAQAGLARLVVVDNASAQPPPAGPATLLRNARNAGIATASNQGLQALRAAGCSHALLLDQDSDIDADCIAQLRAAAAQAPADALGVVPGLRHPLPEMRCRWPQAVGGGRRAWRFRFVHAQDLRELTPVHVAISSGMLLRLDRMQALGDFDDSLYIDLVDTDLCLRARTRGWQLYAVPGAWMPHAIGRPARRGPRGLPMYPTHHGAARHYTLARNRIRLYRRHAWRHPFWAAYETLGGLKLAAKVLAFEPGRLRKLAAMLAGSWAGLRGRGGPAPARWQR